MGYCKHAGYAGVIQFGGVRIGGLSGIYKPRDYNKGNLQFSNVRLKVFIVVIFWNTYILQL